MQPDPHAIQIFVDGSSLIHRKRESGYAGFALYPDDPVEKLIAFHGVRESTINRMELAACIAGMEWTLETRPAVTRVQIFSDSQYVIDGTFRAQYWQKNKWRNSQGRPIDHPELWKQFLTLRAKIGRAGIRVDFGRVKGKSSNLLKMVDKTAKEAARTATALDLGYRKGKIGRPKLKGGAPTMFSAAGQVMAIRVYGARVVGKTDENKIRFEIYDEVTNQYGPKHIAYAQQQVGGDLHQQRIFRVQMNSNPQYPQIVAVLEEIPLPKKPVSFSLPHTAEKLLP